MHCAAGVAKFEDVVQRVSAARNHVVLTLCSFDYAEAALVWYHANAARGVEGLLVVAMDLGAYSYLSNREVPVVYLPTIAPLAPCCLHSFKMVPWRATNDVKVHIFKLKASGLLQYTLCSCASH